MKKSIKITLLLLLAILWMITIFKLSSMNSKNSNGRSIGIINLFIEDALDITNEYGITSSYPDNEKLIHASELINAPIRKAIHAIVYFVLAFFIITFIGAVFEHKNFFIMFILTFIFCILFSAGDEFHQTFVSGRTGHLLDVAIDMVGSCIGIIFYSTYYFCYRCGYKQGMEEKKKNNIDK
ncbi:MAG: VanZ family protein [Clostridia bacterium]|nr:VanZ family protein [Clostridia bacterium]